MTVPRIDSPVPARPGWAGSRSEPPPAPGSSRRQGSVELRQVSKRFGDHQAVDRLDLRIESGEFLSLLGPSGCGKTTTLRMLAGFEHPDSGEIEISGASVIGIPAHRRNVNTVFQAYALFPHLSVADNIAYGLRQRRIATFEIRTRVAQALDLVQLRQLADRRPQALSGGQQQRVALARALVNRPAVLLLDEPLGALDRKLRDQMQLELKVLQARLGTTFLFVTHDQGEALSMSDRIAVMRDGRIEQLADPDTIYHDPASAYVAAFIGQQNFLTGTLADATTVRSPGIVLRAGAPAGLPLGTAVQAAVRPEHVQLHAGPFEARRPETDNSAFGILVSRAHQGEALQYLVQLDGGAQLLARRPSVGSQQLRPGDRVLASWPAEHVRIFAAADGETIASTEPTASHSDASLRPAVGAPR